MISDLVPPLETLRTIPDTWAAWRFTYWSPWLASRLLHTAFYICGAVLLDRLWRILLRRIKARVEGLDAEVRTEVEQRVRTLASILRQAGRTVIALAVTLIILHDFGLEIGPLLAGMGIVGVAVGFGAQYLVRDLIAGFFAILEDQYRVGDVIQVNQFTGSVELIQLRTTRLRAAGGEMIVIPNGEIRCLTNFTRDWARAILDIGVAYGSDLGEAFQALREAGRRAAEDPAVGAAFLEAAEVQGITQLTDSHITVRLWVKTKPQQKWEAERLLRRMAVEVFAERGISFPSPLPTLQVSGVLPGGAPGPAPRTREEAR